MKKQQGMAALLVIVLLVGAFGVGFIFKKATNIINHPLEQASEQILARHGIDIDFSADKIKARDKANK